MITILYTFGPLEQVCSRKLRQMLLSREYGSFFVLICVIVAVLNPLDATRQQPPVLQVMIWLFAASLFHFTMVLFTWIPAVIRHRTVLLYTPFIYAFALFMSEGFNYLLHFVVLNAAIGEYPGITARIALQLTIVITAEQIFIRFVWPSLVSKTYQPDASHAFEHSPDRGTTSPQMSQVVPESVGQEAAFEPSPSVSDAPAPSRPSSEQAKVQVGERAFLATEIRLLIAQEHYTKVITRDGSYLLRCKISSAINQLPPDLGMQIHRSFWIAFTEVHDIIREGPGKYSVITMHGPAVPLSRERHKQLKQVLRQRRP